MATGNLYDDGKNFVGGAITALDTSPNGSLASAADTVYTCTLEINEFTTAAVAGGVGYNKNAVTIGGTAIAVEMRV